MKTVGALFVAAALLSSNGPVGPARAATHVTPKLSPDCMSGPAMRACRFSFTGAEQQFVVPDGIRHLRIIAVGAGGKPGYLDWQSAGAQVSATIPVRPHQALYINVGALGLPFHPAFNGGTNGGGGASDLRTCPSSDPACPALGSASDPRLVVAAGAGGGGTEPNDFPYPGGDGGLLGQPGDGGATCVGFDGGRGGPKAGGCGGAANDSVGHGQPGEPGVGGRGAGGGGGGFFGGGGGGIWQYSCYENCIEDDGAGGGGSSFVEAKATDTSSQRATNEDPRLTVEYHVSATAVSVSLTSGNSPSPYGRSLTFTATVTPASGPTGPVTFWDGAPGKPGTRGAGDVCASGKHASITTHDLHAGANRVYAVYAGDPKFGASQATILTRIFLLPPLRSAR